MPVLNAAFLHSNVYFFFLGLLCGVVGFRRGWSSGLRWLLPSLQGLLGFLGFAAAWWHDGALAGAVAVGGWAFGSTIVAIPAFWPAAERTDRLVLRAQPYRESMFDWLRTGRGPETRPLATLRAHALELALYLAAALATANLASMILGAVLLNYMNAYVASLLRSAHRFWLVLLLGWNVWSLIRVAAYVMLGVACAAPIATWLGLPPRPGEVPLLLWMGGVGVVLDVALKLLLSRPAGRALAASIDL